MSIDKNVRAIAADLVLGETEATIRQRLAQQGFPEWEAEQLMKDSVALAETFREDMRKLGPR